MIELLNTGKRIRHFRMLRGITQKTLGIAIGFPLDTADVRIAQYESGARTPKQNLLCQIAKVLGVPPSKLAVPRIRTHEELYCLFVAPKDECGIVLSPQSDNAKRFMKHLEKGRKTMKTYYVTITETLQKTVEVEAASREQAQELVERKWNDSEYILDADAFKGMDFQNEFVHTIGISALFNE